MGELMVDILIESTIDFEQDLGKLAPDLNTVVMESINNCGSLFSGHKRFPYDRLQLLPLRSSLKDYDSSLYVLNVLEKLNVILTVDQDPIFDQVIFTLFRVVQQDELNRAYQHIAGSLYQELAQADREIAQAA